VKICGHTIFAKYKCSTVGYDFITAKLLNLKVIFSRLLVSQLDVYANHKM